ncbi:MAG: glycosyltransferase, partial [Planctomycetota bacterium]
MISLLAMFAAIGYVAATLFLAAQGLHSLWLLGRFLRHRRRQSAQATLHGDDVPVVLVQLPVFNERDVVARLVAAMGRLDWPRERLRVQLLDDSTDDSVTLGAAAVATLQHAGVQAVHLRRGDRTGFKAGALEYGLAVDARHPDGPAPFVAIFDADFVPAPDFLRRTLPPLLGCVGMAFVQTRWEHLNPDDSLLTRAQAIGIDGHFAIEQAARAWSGLTLNFNGTCGVWRRAAIDASGGWQHDTLTEDLDLSYRAQLAGYRAGYLLDTAVPGELPPTLEAWRAQQFRWAKGSLQTAIKLLPSIWRSGWSLARKLGATMHLSHYLVHPAILCSLLLSPLAALVLRELPAVAMFCGVGLLLAGLVPPLLLYVTSQRVLGRPLRKLLALPALMSFGTGIALSNTRAAVQALLGAASPFVRTPKHGAGPGTYRAAPALGVGELAIGVFGSIGCMGVWTSHSLWLMPAIALYVLGFLLQGAVLLQQRVREAVLADQCRVRPLWPLVPLGLLAFVAVALLGNTHATWRQQPWWFAGCGLVVGACCVMALRRVSTARASLPSLVWILVVGVALQAVAMGLPLSDDVHRYAVEGAQLLAQQNPYAVAPAAANLPGVIVAGVNHAEMTSIYPPLMLWVHQGVMAAWPGEPGFRALALAGIAALAVLGLALLVLMRRSPLLLVAVLWNPALVLFTAGEAHHDVVMAAVLVASLLALQCRLPRTCILLAATAALLKPFAVVALPLLLLATSWRHVWIPVAAALVAYLPFAAAGQGLVASLFTFGGTMQFHGAIEPMLAPIVASLLPGDAVASTVRALLAVAFVIGFVWLCQRSRGEVIASRVARAVALLLLCLPTLHPWYFTLLVALLPFTPSRVLVAWTAAAPVYWLHGVAMADDATWAEWPWATSLAHLPF